MADRAGEIVGTAARAAEQPGSLQALNQKQPADVRFLDGSKNRFRNWSREQQQQPRRDRDHGWGRWGPHIYGRFFRIRFTLRLPRCTAMMRRGLTSG
jgi:hypothetical protein